MWGGLTMGRERRRVRRVAAVDYDRGADAAQPVNRAGDGERIVEFDDDAPELTDTSFDLEYYESQRPPHHG